MPIFANKRTITSEKPQVIAGGAVAGDKKKITIVADGPMFLGGDGVDSEYGFPWDGGKLDVELGPGDALYGITESGEVTLNILSLRS